MTRSLFFFGLVLLLAGSIAIVSAWAARRTADAREALEPARRELVAKLLLTDLAIWTEARYSRHPSQADLFTPFQEFPGAFEHFPAGSLLAPPKLTSDLLTSPGQSDQR